MRILKALFMFFFLVAGTVFLQAKDETDPFAEVSKILVIGNSLSRHAPLESLGWSGDWGMAATSRDKDYVHVLLKKLDERYPGKKHTVEVVRPSNEAAMVVNDSVLKRKADLVIVQIGENYRGKDVAPAYEKILLDIKKRITPNIICVGTWSLGSKDLKSRTPYQDIAEKLNIPYVNIRPLSTLNYSAYRDSHFNTAKDPVRWHPSDRGMAAIADLILKVKIRKKRTLKKSVKASITVDGTRVIGPVNRKVMGQFVVGADGQYIWGNDTPNWEIRKRGDGIWLDGQERPDPKVVELMKALRPGVIRYPGGSSAKNWNWKLLVGPIAQRQEGWHWGLVEYLQFCKEVGAEPQICISEYVGGPEDQKDLVEFLNAPATPEHPWAMKRAEWGHKEPFGVKYFELGNEPYDGNRRVKPRKQWDAEGYADWAVKTAKLMKSVDPEIKLGLPDEGFGSEGDDLILKRAGKYVDFLVRHTYSVHYCGNRDIPAETEDLIMRACLATAPQIEYTLKMSKKRQQELHGRILPFAVTEYNTLIESSKPRPYRNSMGAGLFCIDYVFRMLKPKNKILLANYWQMINGFWGSVRTGDKYSLMPPYYCYKMVAQNLGDELVKASTKCPRIEFEGFCHTAPAKGRKFTPAKILNINLYSDKFIFLPPQGMKFSGGEVKRVGNEIRFSMNNFTHSGYPSFATIQSSQIPAEYRPGSGIVYEFSFEGCLEAKPGSGKLNLGLGIMDGRGWQAAGSAIGVEGVDKPHWKRFSGIYNPLKDTPNLVILGRLLAGTKPVNGVFRVRNIQLKPMVPKSFPAYPCLSVNASKGDGKLYILIVNKYTDRKVNTSINLKNFAATSATVQKLTSPEAASVTGARISVAKKVPCENNQIDVSLEPHSITAVVCNQ